MARKTFGYIETAPGVKKYREMVVRDLVAVEDAATMSREQNVAGLSSAITMANEARTDMISHFANVTRHDGGAQSTATIAPAATDLASLITLTTSLMALYVIHQTDADLAAAWVYHKADEGAGNALASAVAPTNLQTAITRLTDFRTKWNAHENGNTSHTNATVAGDEIDAAAPDYGAANLVPVTDCEAGCRVFWSVLDSGTGTVTGVSASAGDGGVTFTFSADPQNDAIISYMVARPAA